MLREAAQFLGGRVNLVAIAKAAGSRWSARAYTPEHVSMLIIGGGTH